MKRKNDESRADRIEDLLGDLERAIWDAESAKDALADELQKAADEDEEKAKALQPDDVKATALKLLADPANWDGNVWRPFMAEVERDEPFIIAEKALQI